MWYAKSKIISVISCSIFFQPEVIHFETFHTCISDSYFFKFYWYKIIEHDHQHIHLQNAPLCNSLLISFRGCQKMITIVVKRLPEVSPHIGPGQWTSVQIQQVCRLAKEKWQSSLKNLYNIYLTSTLD